MKTIAVITGASSGIGREFAKRIAEKYKVDELWLLARSEEKLRLAAEAFVLPSLIIPCDLTNRASIDNYTALLREKCVQVSVLVNASGYGEFGAFTDIPLDLQVGMIDLNTKALMAMTYVTLPYMKKGGHIYQLCSMSSFQPVPYIGVYAATKAFALSFSRALNRELKKTGIRVLAVSPGWVKTAFFDRAVRDGTIVYYNRFFTPEQIVDRAFSDMRNGKDVSVCGFSIKAHVFFAKLLPHRLVMWVWCRQQKKK